MFRDLETERLFAHISVDNAASVRTVLNLGFVRSGERYDEEFHGREYPHDIYVKIL